jgi:hypothetical protein
MSDIKRMNIKEFVEGGFLQEVNRQFFHPLGLALEVATDADDSNWRLSGVWDYRDDPEGMFYDMKDINEQKISNVQRLRGEKLQVRRGDKLRCDWDGIQQLPHHRSGPR